MWTRDVPERGLPADFNLPLIIGSSRTVILMWLVRQVDTVRIVPRDEKFFDQIEQLSSLSRSSAQCLKDLVRRFPAVDGLAEQIKNSREKALGLMQSSLQRLDNAFITPLDREDIMQLIADLYDVIDKIDEVARRFSLYKLERLYPNLHHQSDTLLKVVITLDTILHELRHEKKLKELSSALQEIDSLEKEAAANRDKFLSELFDGSPDPLEVIKKKELHDMLESAVWDCENVTRTLGRVLLKNG